MGPSTVDEGGPMCQFELWAGTTVDYGRPEVAMRSFVGDYGGPEVAISTFGGDYCGPEPVISTFGDDPEVVIWTFSFRCGLFVLCMLCVVMNPESVWVCL